MKTSIIKFILAASLGASILAHGQTNDASQTNSISPPLTSQVGHVALDAYNQFKSLSWKDGITVEPLAIYHKGDFGAGLAVSTASTNGLNYGFAIAEIHDKKNAKWNFYDASLGISLGRQVTIPFIRLPVFAYIETGPALNLAHPSAPLIQSVAGFKASWRLNDRLTLTGGGGVLHNSEWSADIGYLAHLGLVYVPKKW